METYHCHSNKKTTEFLFDGVHGPFMVLEFEMVLPVPIAYASAWRMGEIHTSLEQLRSTTCVVHVSMET